MMQKVPVGPYYFYADPKDGTGHLFTEQGIGYEAHIRKELERLIPKCTCFLDIGANVGLHTLNAKSIRPDMPIICIEVNPDTSQWLMKAIVENNLHNIAVINGAVAERNGILQIDRRHSNSTVAHLGSWPTDADGASLAPCFRLNFFNLRHVDLVKMDIDGFEYRALQGASELMKNRPTVIFEYHLGVIERGGIKGPELLQFFTSRNYKLTVMDFMRNARLEFDCAIKCHNYVTTVPGLAVDILAEPL